ncbi:MAG TPA: sulfatase-like hydrolase/transferase [Thermoleophilaceae bacterium]
MKRFPNFAAFAAQGTWYRHATTISESTRFSVPAILDGRRPRPRVREDYAGHPRNLFTLLRGRYRMNVAEEATTMCPVPLCPPQARTTVIQRMRKGRVTRFRRGVARISSGRPQLTFIHTLLPHEPRQYLPDGRAYISTSKPDPLGGLASIPRRFLSEQLEQRNLLQLQFADRLLGELVGRLKGEGIWDRSLVALASDHGESFANRPGPAPQFRVGELTFRRAASERNLQDIAGIALFVKYPGQQHGRTDDRFVRHVDLLPTILHFARISRPAGLIGHRLDDTRYRGHRTIAVYKQDGRLLTMAASRWLRRLHASKRRELALFGSGEKSIFDFGPAPQLRGTPVDRLELRPRTALRATVANAGARTTASFLPAQVSGRIRGGRTSGHTLLFALNGTVVATAPSFAPVNGYSFSAMLPPDAFHLGANRLEIFEWLGGLEARRIYG